MDWIEKIMIIMLIIEWLVKMFIIAFVLYFMICYVDVIINNLDSDWVCPSWNILHFFK